MVGVPVEVPGDFAVSRLLAALIVPPAVLVIFLGMGLVAAAATVVMAVTERR